MDSLRALGVVLLGEKAGNVGDEHNKGRRGGIV